MREESSLRTPRPARARPARPRRRP
jgi:hypothetical protein